MHWQPMCTAPLDGTLILLKTPTGLVSAWFAKGESSNNFENPSEVSPDVWVCYDDAFHIECQWTPAGPDCEAIGWVHIPTSTVFPTAFSYGKLS